MSTTSGFTGFDAAHFDAYEEKKWSSNRFNLERMRVRELVETLVNQVTDRLGEAASGLGLSTTADHPSVFNKRQVDSQWVLLGRPAEERKRIQPLLTRETSVREAVDDPLPQHHQAVLSLRIDQQGVEVSLRLHRHAHLDRANLAKRLSDEGGRAALVERLSKLPEALRVGRSEQAANSITTDELAQWAEKLDDAEWWSLVRHFGRDDAAVADAGFADVVHDLFAGLLPIYRFVAWSEENDLVDGAAFLAAEAERLAEAAEQASEPAVKNAPKPESQAPSTRGGWSYRPDWKMEPVAAPEPRAARSPSARVRERAAEAAEQARGWSYSGPVRQPPANPSGDEQDGRGRSGSGSERQGNARRGNDARPGNDRPRNDRSRNDRSRNERGGNGRGGNERGRGGAQADGNRGGGNRGGGRPGDRPGNNAGNRGGNRRGGDRPGGERRGNERGGRPGDDRRGGGRGGPGSDRSSNRRNDRGRGGRRDDRQGGRGGRTPKTTTVGAARSVAETTWTAAEGAVALHDYVRVSGGLMNGKVGKVVEVTSKGNFKVALGDGGMVFEVKKDAAAKVTGE